MTEEKEHAIEGLPELQPVGETEEVKEEKPEEAKEEPEKTQEEPTEPQPEPVKVEEPTTEEPKEEEKPEEVKEDKEEPSDDSDAEPRVYAIRTTVGKENTVAEFLANRVKLEKLDVSSVMAPAGLKGYIFIESTKRNDVLKAIHSIQHIRGLIGGEVAFTEIEHYLEAKSVKTIPEKALVELISGPFKGEKAKIVRVDQSKDSVTVELIEATVPIPITVKMDAVRVLAEDTSVLQSKEIKEGER